MLTEKGITFMSVPFLLDSKPGGGFFDKMGQMPSEIKELMTLKNQLVAYDTGKLHKKPSFQEVSLVLREIIELCKISHKTTFVSLFYPSETLLIKAQEVFIELAFHCIKFADLVIFDFKGYYYQILSLVFRRAELDLAQAGFLTKITETGSDKQKVSINYLFLLSEALKYALEKLVRKAVDFYKREFLEIFLALAYFRIPPF